MGRVKGRHIKMAAENLLEKGEAAFEGTFKEIKEQIKKLGILPKSRKEQNKLSGRIYGMKNMKRRVEAENADSER